MARKKTGLSPQETLFCQFYSQCLNAAEAIRMTGSTVARPRQAAYQLLRRPAVRAAVDELIAVKSSAHRRIQAQVLEHLSQSLAVNVGDFVDRQGQPIPIRKLPPHVRAACAELVVKEYQNTEQQKGQSFKLKLTDKVGICRLLASHGSPDMSHLEIGSI